MKKTTLIPVLALLALPLFSCGENPASSALSSATTNSEVSLVSSETSTVSSENTTASSANESSASNAESTSSESSTSSSTENHATGLTVTLFEKMPKVKNGSSSKEETCLFYPASEFELGAVVIPHEALEQNVVVTIPEEHKDEISYENGKLITKNVYTTIPFDIVVSIEGTEISLTQKVAVVTGSNYLAVYLNDHLAATDEGEEKCATNASYGVFYGPEKTDGSAPDDGMDIVYFENEITETQLKGGKSITKRTNRIGNGYYYTVNFNEDGTTIDLDSSSKTPIGDGENQISSEKAAYQVNRVLYMNDRYGLTQVMSDQLLRYEFMDGGSEHFKETLRFGIIEDSDARFSVDIVGNKPYQYENETKPFYMNVKFDILFDSAKRITSFKWFLAYSETEDPTKVAITPTADNSETIVLKINYADRKSANPSPVDFSEVALEPTASEKVQRKIANVAEQLNEIEGERAANARLEMVIPEVVETYTNVSYYQDETIMSNSIVSFSGNEQSVSETKTVMMIRDNNLYDLNYDFTNDAYSVTSTTVIGDGEGQISQTDAIYQANHIKLDSSNFGLGTLVEETFTMGLVDETVSDGSGVTFNNIGTTILSDSSNKNSFRYTTYYSMTVPGSSPSDTDVTMWYASTADLSFNSSLNSSLYSASLNVSIYATSPFDGEGNLNKEATPDYAQSIRISVEYCKGNEKEANPDPIVF